MLLLKHKTRKN
nr:Ycf15 protein [Swertia dichotoma]QWW91810.1 Ycf15 protein [Swertia tetraptera]QWW91063.1 Ycf15 protein [Swertia dichotoma]QWW91827.1 Ycf15 protein [Swertia tetraptera]UZM11124.1 hypothetical protein RF15 [Swertia tetraptera]